MDLIRNNIKALVIHLLCIPFFLIGLFLYVAASPLYKSEYLAMIIAIISYVALYTGYFALHMKFLKSSKIKIYNVFSGLLVVVVSLVIWRLTYINNQSVAGIEAYAEIWIPYNLYNFMLWPISYTVKDHNLIWIFSVLNGLFAPIAIGLKNIRDRKQTSNSKVGILVVLFCSVLSLYSVAVLGEIQEKESEEASRFIDSSGIEFSKVDNNIWVHTSYINYNGVRTPSNGLIIVTEDGLLLVDTPWNNDQTEALLRIAKERFNQSFTTAIITHAHSDRIGGIDTLLRENIKTFSTGLTQKQAEKNGYAKPQYVLESGESVKLGQLNIEIYYLGEGHSQDNIVVWIPSKKLLFAGCLVKSLDEDNLGGSEDSNYLAWSVTLEKLKEKFQDARIVIPGHGEWGDIGLIEHTLRLTKRKYE